MLRKILHWINLDAEVDDFDKIHAQIEKDIIFQGTNLWILIFAILVACVGLNMNSTAVVIGAMLISPLMGPINGVGYSIATYDFPLFRRALNNYGFAVGAGLVASTAYFAISPVSTAHSELLARTSPTIYDVLIALFGGLAGIVAISSKQKGNVIPGVAIATALMPPLCTAGYGLATGQFYYFFGALYLFTINSVFIAIAALTVSQILKFPIRTLVDPVQKIRVTRWISAVITVTILPSIYFGYGLVQKERFVESANHYVRNVSIYEGNYLLRNEINPTQRAITLVYGGTTLTDQQKEAIRSKAADFTLDKDMIRVEQGLAFDDGSRRVTEMETLKSEIGRLSEILADREEKIDSIYQRATFGRELLAELQALFPQISSCAFSDAQIFHSPTEPPDRTAFVVLSTNDKPLNTNEREIIERFLKTRLSPYKLRIVYE